MGFSRSEAAHLQLESINEYLLLDSNTFTIAHWQYRSFNAEYVPHAVCVQIFVQLEYYHLTELRVSSN